MSPTPDTLNDSSDPTNNSNPTSDSNLESLLMEEASPTLNLCFDSEISTRISIILSTDNEFHNRISLTNSEITKRLNQMINDFKESKTMVDNLNWTVIEEKIQHFSEFYKEFHTQLDKAMFERFFDRINKIRISNLNNLDEQNSNVGSNNYQERYKPKWLTDLCNEIKEIKNST